jgi:hypothetical protein
MILKRKQEEVRYTDYNQKLSSINQMRRMSVAPDRLKCYSRLRSNVVPMSVSSYLRRPGFDKTYKVSSELAFY